MEDLKTPKGHFEINRPLAQFNYPDRIPTSQILSQIIFLIQSLKIF